MRSCYKRKCLRIVSGFPQYGKKTLREKDRQTDKQSGRVRKGKVKFKGTCVKMLAW